MVTRNAEPRRLESVWPRVLGAVASVVGLGCLLVYPLAVPVVYPLAPVEVLPGPDPAVFEATHPFVVYCSAVGGAMVGTWGVFALRHRTLTPLTERRALLAPLSSLLSIVAGIGVFTYAWTREQPIGWCATEPPADFSVPQIVHIEIASAQPVALAAISSMIVGVIASERGWRRAAASAVLPIGLVIVAVVWQPRVLSALELLFLVVLASVPFSVGYATARQK